MKKKTKMKKVKLCLDSFKKRKEWEGKKNKPHVKFENKMKQANPETRVFAPKS